MSARAIRHGEVAPRKGSAYPAPYGEPCAERLKRPLGKAGGLTRFGVNHVTLPPGCWSSQRHWHSHEDEFVFVLSGELVLVTDEGEEVLAAGTAAAFPAGDGNGHHLVNRSERPAEYLEVGDRRTEDRVEYSDIDMVKPAPSRSSAYTRRDGSPLGD